MKPLMLDPAVLDTLAPMMLVFDPKGRVSRVGPVFERMAPGALDRPIRDVLRFITPHLPPTAPDLLGRTGRTLRVELLHEADVAPGELRVQLRGAVVPLGGGWGLIKLSLGADPSVALRRHRLTAKDFAEADPMFDYLFLVEVHGLLHSEFERLGERLDQARSLAEEAAVTDKLTGLHNRRALDAHLARLTRAAQRPFGLMHLDLDYFKSVNDTLGHAAGDWVLREVAGILRDEVRSDDMVARTGGDEFMLVFEDCTDVDLLRRIADRIIARLERPIDWEGHACLISGSIGITMSKFYARLDADQLVSDVDTALYASKRAGRARASVAQASGHT